MLSSFCVRANAVGPSIWSQIETGFLASKAFMKCVGLVRKCLDKVIGCRFLHVHEKSNV